MTRHTITPHPHVEHVANGAVLAEDLDTPFGTYAAGLPVLVLEAVAGRSAIICLDNGGHMRGGRCHVAAVPMRALRVVGPR